MRDTKQPATQVPAWASAAKMVEKGKKGLLNNIFGIMQRQAEAKDVVCQPRLMLVEEMNDHALRIGLSMRS